jgi:uncharacterized protein
MFTPGQVVDDRAVLREVAIFYIVTLALTGAVAAALWSLPPDFKPGDIEAVRQAVNRIGDGAIFVPIATAVGCTLAFGGWKGMAALVRRVVTVRVSPIYYLSALIAPVVPQWLAAVLWTQVTGEELSYPPLTPFLIYWIQATLFGTVILLGEEIGWRGFVLPRLLQRFGWRPASLVSGMLWALWHLFFWVPANYAATGSLLDTALIVLAASLGAIALSVVITWLFVHTRYSVAIAALVHASGNASMGKVYDMLGNSLIEPLWLILYNTVLVAVAIMVMLLADRRTTSAPTAPHKPTN